VPPETIIPPLDDSHPALVDIAATPGIAFAGNTGSSAAQIAWLNGRSAASGFIRAAPASDRVRAEFTDAAAAEPVIPVVAPGPLAAPGVIGLLSAAPALDDVVVAPAPAPATADGSTSGSGSSAPAAASLAAAASAFTINLVWDASALAAPPSFRAGVAAAAAILQATVI